MAIKKLCNKVGWDKLIARNQNPPYCEEHLPHIKKYRNQLRASKKDKFDEFYQTPAWKNMRDYILSKNNYLCGECRKENRYTDADTVHHIVHLRAEGGWELRLKESNLMPVCRACHNKIHRNERGGNHHG